MPQTTLYIAATPSQAIPLRPAATTGPCGSILRDTALVCTREPNHRGPHVAHGYVDGEPAAWAVWEDAPDRCSQCGRPYTSAACGPTHAVIAAERSIAS